MCLRGASEDPSRDYVWRLLKVWIALGSSPIDGTPAAQVVDDAPDLVLQARVCAR